jgi:hypothetical protein
MSIKDQKSQAGQGHGQRRCDEAASNEALHYDYIAIAVDQAKCRKVSAGRLAKWWETGASVEGSLSTGDDPQLNRMASMLGSDQTTEVDKIGSWPA